MNSSSGCSWSKNMWIIEEGVSASKIKIMCNAEILQNEISPLVSKCSPSIIHKAVCGRRRSIWINLHNFITFSQKWKDLSSSFQKRFSNQTKAESDSALKMFNLYCWDVIWMKSLYFSILDLYIIQLAAPLRTGLAKRPPNLGWRRRTEMLLKNCHRHHQFHRHCDQRQNWQKDRF